jgi:hypothetical protein
MYDFSDRSSQNRHRSDGDLPVLSEEDVNSATQFSSLGATTIPIKVKQVISALKLAESSADVFQVFAVAEEQLKEMRLIGGSSRWIGEYGFRRATPAAAENMRQNLDLCQERGITCAPRLVETIVIPDKTAVVVLMLPGGGAAPPRLLTRGDVISPDVGEQYVENVRRLGELGFVNVVSSDPGKWLIHAASRGIILEDWSSLWPATKEEVSAVIKEIRSYF